ALGQRDAAAARRLLPPDREGVDARQRALRGNAAHRRPQGRPRQDHRAVPPHHRPVRSHRAAGVCAAARPARRLARQGGGHAAGRARQHRRRAERGEADVAEARCLAAESFDMTTTRTYPRTVACGDAQVEIARMTAGDRAALVAFVATLAPQDLLFVPRDLGHPKVVDAWMRSLETGELVSLVARSNGEMVGCTAIFVDELSWSKHVGELRVLVSPTWRGRGLGRALIQECFAQALELGLTK